MTSQKKQNATTSMVAETHLSRGTLWGLLAGIFLISFSLLAFEITLARILSVLLLYHFVFLVVSLALLGLGAGGIYVYLFRPQIPTGDSRFGSLALFASLFALAIPVSVMVMTRIAYLNNELAAVLLYSLFLFIPFFLAGVLLANVFRMFPADSSRIYGADLVGAALGALGVIFVLSALGDINSSLFFALIAAVAALLFATRATRINSRGIILPAVSLVVMLVLLGTNLVGAYLPNVPVGRNPIKEISQFLEVYHGPTESGTRGETVETRWSAFGRTDMVAPRDDPNMMVFFIDGTAGTPMYRFNGDWANPGASVLSLKTEFTGFLPFLHLSAEERNNALIIGPGGGRDILVARLGGVEKITAVEVNRELVAMVKEYASFNGGIYTGRDNVSVVVDEGRNFLKRQKEQYDIIMLSLVVTNTSRALEGFSLTENYLYTIDAINDYLAHLTDEGRLIMVAHSPVEILRLLSITLGAFEQQGVDNATAMKQIYIVGSEMLPIFVVKKTPFAAAEMQALYQSINELGYDPASVYLPTVEQGNYTPQTEVFWLISKGERRFSDLEKVFQEQSLADIGAVTDDSPFFHKFGPGIPPVVSLVAGASFITLLLAILVSFVYYRKRGASLREVLPRGGVVFNRPLLRVMLFFSMLGAGFMLVEISTIQRLILFLGQPVLSLAILLFSLLIGAGIGSMYSDRFTSERIVRVVAVVCLSIVAALLSYTFLLPLIFNQLLGLALAIRLLATFVLLAPLGFLMGFPFPLGLRLLKEVGMANYIPWMWGINGIASVLGSALTLILAIKFGFTETLFVGAAGYFIAFLIFGTAQYQGGLIGKGGEKDG